MINEKSFQLLNSIEIQWNSNNDNWNKQFEEAKLFYQKNGHLNISKVSPLYNFILFNKQSKKKNTISKERIDKLESIGMIWDTLEDTWNKMYAQATIYFNENGHLNPKESSPLYYWLANNRKLKEKNLLSEERKEKLESIGIYWNPIEDIWDTQFEKASLYFEMNGHINFKPKSPMNIWILSNILSYKKKTLSEERKIKLETIGILWTPYKKKWYDRFEEAKLFYKKNGHLNFKYRSTMSNWVKLNRKKKIANKLSEERFALLDSIGMDWKS